MNASLTSVRAVVVRQPVDAKARIGSAELLGGQSLIVIEHDGQDYFLRQTKAGKLILTK
ncbi:hemin uptake protein HemP [Simiduia aestuariiviva]|uniref:Hemin uptake protein HemP n=1 Tax=Simiduia aestuariiviva TaxID=1510459 RepID=A0A839UPA3_9GAMM|nr:hemin uptake protein HemP [Simiduia aestuariiviva]MBB3169672.1 hemin uptake protein HemP [Simiduia aestuariiviva]